MAGLLASTCLGAGAAHAVDGTFTGPGAEWTTGTNWSSTPTVPDGTATFIDNAAPTAVTVTIPNAGSDVTVGTIQFNAGRPQTTFSVLNAVNSTDFFAVNGTGIVNNSASAPIFNIGDGTNAGSMRFLNSATAGNATLNSNGQGVLFFQGDSTAGASQITIANGGTLSFLGSAKAGTATIVNQPLGFFGFFNSASAEQAHITNNSELHFDDSSTAANATIINGAGGTILFGDSSTAGESNISTTRAIFFNGGSSAGNATITVSGAIGLLSLQINSNGGTARVILELGGVMNIARRSDAGTFVGSIEGPGNLYLGSRNLEVGGNDRSTEFSGVISDCGVGGFECQAFGASTGGSLTKVGTGTLTLSGINTYTGDTNVNAGTLLVTGSIASSSILFVNSGATVGGTGIVPFTIVGNGATLAPGLPASLGTLTINDRLVFCDCSNYEVKVSSAGSDLTQVVAGNVLTGTAALAGTVRVNSLNGTYRFTQPYTILSAAGGFESGFTQFGSLVLNAPAGINGVLSYTANDVLLTLTSNLGSLPGLNQNQQSVAKGLDAAFNSFGSTGALSSIFAGNIGNNLTQVSGEYGAGVLHTSFEVMRQFLNVLLDPFVDGRGSDGGVGAVPFAAEDDTLAYASRRKPSKAEREAYAAFMPIKAAPPAPFAPQWSVWAAGFGGSGTTSGDAQAGSQTTTSRIYGFAGGADYRLTRDTLFGFALSGGGTSYSLSGGLGGGRSELFQAGAFVRHRMGPAYVAATLAYGWQDVTTNRNVAVAGLDRLEARFQANTLAARLEAGHRIGMASAAITPYAAGQAITVHLPAYSETAVSGNNAFALSYAAQTATATRSELGARADISFAALQGIATLRGRLAWAHDFNTSRTVTPTFQALPGPGFTVNGARPDADSALTTLGVDVRWANGWSMAGSFEGEFSSNTQIYAGKGTVRRTW